MLLDTIPVYMGVALLIVTIMMVNAKRTDYFDLIFCFCPQSHFILSIANID